MNNNFELNYIKCPNCQNILDMYFVNTSCPNPLCGFHFAGLEPYLSRNDDELRKILIAESIDKNSKEYMLVVTAIKHNMAKYLAHFIECTWPAHYETLYSSFLLNFLDDLNVLKIVLKSDVIQDSENTTISKNGYKMYWQLYCRLRKLTFRPEISNFLKIEFPNFYRRHYNNWFLKYEKFKRDKRSGKNPNATLL